MMVVSAPFDCALHREAGAFCQRAEFEESRARCSVAKIHHLATKLSAFFRERNLHFPAEGRERVIEQGQTHDYSDICSTRRSSISSQLG